METHPLIYVAIQSQRVDCLELYLCYWLLILLKMCHYSANYKFVRFELLMMVFVKTAIFQDVTPCSKIEMY